MVQIIPQTYEEKFQMYMEIPKEELIQMLLECHRILDIYKSNIPPYKILSNPEGIKTAKYP